MAVQQHVAPLVAPPVALEVQQPLQALGCVSGPPDTAVRQLLLLRFVGVGCAVGISNKLGCEDRLLLPYRLHGLVRIEVHYHSDLEALMGHLMLLVVLINTDLMIIPLLYREEEEDQSCRINIDITLLYVIERPV